MNFPQPPIDMAMPETAQLWFTVFLFLPLAVLVPLGLRLWIRDHEPILLLCLLGGSLAMFLEPVVDVLGLVWFPRENQWVLFETFGRPIPVLMAFVYAWYVGGQGYLAWRVFQRGVTRRQVFQLYATFALLNAIIETPGLIADVYTYYGRQPFDFWGFPLWWAAVNAAMPVMVGALVYRLAPYLTGWRLLGTVALVPMADGVVNGAVGWPTWVALNTGMPSLITWTAGAVTIGLACFLVWIISLAVGRDTATGHRRRQETVSLATPS
jgi:hypothetical protein